MSGQGGIPPGGTPPQPYEPYVNPFDYSTGDFSGAAHAGGGSRYQQINGQWYEVSDRTGYKTKINGVSVQPYNGANYYVGPDGTVLGLYTPPKTGATNFSPFGGASGGATWYEQQQVALDKQRIKDAEAAQAAQLAYQHQQQLIAESNAVEAANQAYRDLQLKSTYATSNGMAFASPKGSPFAEKLPEPLLLKEAYKDSGQADPWNAPAMVGGYTGSTFMNPQQPGLFNSGDPSMQRPTSGPGSIIPPPSPSSPSPSGTPIPTGADWQRWHDIAHQLGPPVSTTPGDRSAPTAQLPPGTYQGGPSGAVLTIPPSGAQVPSMALGGMVPGNPGQPQLIVAHGGETIIPRVDRAEPTMASAYDVAHTVAQQGGMTGSIPGYADGGVVPDYSSASSMPTDYNSFMTWHDAMHQAPIGSYSTDGPRGIASVPPIGFDPSNGRGPRGIDNFYPGAPPPSSSPFSPMPTTNSYGQNVGANVAHGPQYNDIMAGQGVLNHQVYDPVLTGLSGYGATMTPNGTPVVMSNWQRSHLMPSLVSGAGGYDDYAMQIAGWSPDDLKALGDSTTGNFGRDLAAPTNYAPIAVNPAPAGG